VLSGKTKSAEAAEKILQRGELLGPDTCDWHYVEGLTQSDNPRLALVWDKVGLGHNGERLAGGGHTVWRIVGGEEIVPESEWPAFLQEQERLMAARTDAAKKGLPELSAKIRLPSGEIIDHYDGQYTLLKDYFSTNGNRGSGGGSSGQLTASALRWYRLQDDCFITYTLSFNGMRSKPVTVETSQGKASPDSIIFEMHVDGKP
jgi:hypothetical protein